MSRQWQRWLRKLVPNQSRHRQRLARRLRGKRTRLLLEPLEDRLAPALDATLGASPPVSLINSPASTTPPPNATPGASNQTVIANEENSEPSGSESSGNSDEKVSPPQEVTGAFLTNPSQIAQVNGSPFSFTDVEQVLSPTCSFAAALAAVAESNFNLAESLTTVNQLPGSNNYTFAVKLFKQDSQGVYQPDWIDVQYDGTIHPTDLHSTDPTQFWPTLFQRAYEQISPLSDATSFDVGHAFATLTGQPFKTFSVSGADETVAADMFADLFSGQPMVASTRSNGNVTVDSSGVINDDGPIILDSSGLIHDHSYTVLGIDYTSTGPFVTLRNPWGQDTDWTHYDANNDGSLSLSEDAAMRSGLDGVDDGIIRIPWATFTSDFTTCVVSDILGPSINQPLSPVKPTFVQPSISPQTVFTGSTLGPLNLSATSPDGKAISYYLPQDVESQAFPNPGTVDIHTGQFTWTPTASQVGVYNVTVVAQESPVESASLTFQVTVLAAKPVISSFTVDRPALSVNNVQANLFVNDIIGLAPTGSVLIYRDTDHNGVFDSNDTQLASLPFSPSGTYVLPLSSSMLPNLTPGTSETFFAVAQSDATHQGNPVALTMPVIADGSLPTLVAPVGSDTLASAASGAQGFPSYTRVAYDGSGNSAVFWSDAQSEQVFMLRLNPSGSAIGSVIALNTVQGKLDDVAMLPDGHFVIAWDNLSDQLFAMEFNADGTPYTGDFSQTGFAVGSGSGGAARVAIAARGDFAVVAIQSGPSGPQADLYSFVNGVQEGSQLLDGGNSILDVAVAMDDHGAAVVGWIRGVSGQSQGPAMAQHFDQFGTPVGSAATLNTIANSAVADSGISVATDQQGRYVFTWTAQNGANIMARRFLADGTPVDTAEFSVNDSSTGILATPRVAFRGNSFVITWTSTTVQNNTDNSEVFAQAYAWDNTLRDLGGNFEVPATSSGEQFSPTAAIDQSGKNFIIGWTGATSTSLGAFFKRFSGLDNTPLGFGLDAIAPEPTPLFAIPAKPTAGAPLGVFMDPNAGNWTFTLVAGAGSTDNASFQVTNGLLSMTQAGVTSGLKSHYSIRVRATPDAGLPVEQVFDFSGGLSGDINFGQLVPTSDFVHAAAIQPNGQFVVAGTYGSGLAVTALARYNPDGTLDPSFGGTGEVVTHALFGFNFASGVAVQPNGQIVVIGTGFDPIADTNPTFLVRYNFDGSLDTSFGNGGILEEGSDVNASVVAAQDDGKIVIAGSDASKKVAVWRFNANGTLDSTFGSGGKATLALGSQTEFTVSAVAIQPNGAIVVAGFAGNTANGNHIDPFVARFLANGSPDLSLNGGGFSTITSLSGNNKAFALAVQADGKMLLAGSFGLLRLTTGGSLDTTFNGTGVVATASGSTTVVPLIAVAVAPDGTILAAGSASNGTNNDFVFIRYTATGALDELLTKDLGANDFAEALAVAPNGQIDIAGDTTINSGKADDFGVWQINEPVVTGITPSLGFTTGGATVKITGYNFTGVTGVAFGSTAAAFTVVSPTEITATAPPGTGTVDVTVTTAGGTSITSPVDQFGYQVKTTFNTPTVSPSPVHPGGTLAASVSLSASNNIAVSLGAVTFSLVDPTTGATVASDAAVPISLGVATDPHFLVPVGTAPGTYNLVVSYSDNGGTFASTSTTDNNAVTVTPAPLPPPPPAPQPAPSAPPALNIPPLLALFNSVLAGVETIHADGTETITDSIFGFPLLVATFDPSGKLVSVDLFGIDVTFLFG